MPDQTAISPLQLLSPPEVSDLLRVKVKTLAVWRCKGRGPKAVRIGRSVRYLAKDIEAFIAAGVADPAAGGA